MGKSVSDVFIADISAAYDEVATARGMEFVAALKRFFVVLQRSEIYKSFQQAIAVDTGAPAYNSQQKTADEIWRGLQTVFNDPYYREITAYFLLRRICTEGTVPRHLEATANAYIRWFWQRIARTIKGLATGLEVLLRYKKRCEWYDNFFILEELRQFRQAKTKQAKSKGTKTISIRVEEDFFAQKTNKYLFDHGINVVSEEKVAGVRPDVFADGDNGSFLVEYKVLLASNNNPRKYLLEAFKQALGYGKLHQKNVVFLVIFTIGEGDITLALDSLPVDDGRGVPFIESENIKIVSIKIAVKEGPNRGQILKDDLEAFLKR